MIPTLLIEGNRIEDSVCRFDYIWKSSNSDIVSIAAPAKNNIFAHNIGGVNATAKNIGTC